MNNSTLLASCVALCLTMAPAALPDTLSPGEVLGTTFTTVPNTSNVVAFSFNYLPLTFAGSPVVTADFYDGNTLLASFVQSISLPDSDFFSVEFGTAAGFASVPFKDPDSVVADFTSFNNGTIHGRLDIMVSGGFISGFNVPGDISLVSGTLFNEGDFAAIFPSDALSAAPFSITSTTPEPASFLLIGGGSLFVFALRRRFR